jgi:DNA-binding response OmpR family regulator
MIADSDEDMLEKLMTEWQDLYEVIPARDGMEAIEHASRYTPDIFVIDGAISKMSGYQLVMMIYRNAMFLGAPIIFTTQKTDERERQYVEKLGVGRVLFKPYERERLRELVAEAASQPGFAPRPNRVEYAKALMEISLNQGEGAQAGQARWVSHIMRAQQHHARDAHSSPDGSRRG